MNQNRRSLLLTPKWLTPIAATLVASQLSGCVGLLATGAAVGVLAAIDRRSVGTQTDDQAIEVKGFGRLQESIKNPGGIGVTSYNRRVLLSGQVLDAESRAAAERVISGIEGVKQVYNELQVSPRANLVRNAGDVVTTTRVKAAFVDAKDVQANTIKVVTEQGVVYLMGIVTRLEQDRAAQVASRVGGVSRVVTLFELVTDDQLRQIQGSAGK